MIFKMLFTAFIFFAMTGMSLMNIKYYDKMLKAAQEKDLRSIAEQAKAFKVSNRIGAKLFGICTIIMLIAAAISAII